MAMQACPHCGHKNPSGARFCGRCGAPLPADEGTRKRHRHWPIFISALILLLLLAAGAVYITQRPQGPGDDTLVSEPTPVETITPSALDTTETAETIELSPESTQVVSTPTTAPSKTASSETHTETPSSTPAPTNTATVVATATPTIRAFAVAEVAVARASAPPVIDGHLSEWPDSPAYETIHLVYYDDAWDGSDDIGSIWRLLWDDWRLYVGVDVQDDQHVQTQSGNQVYRGDGLEMQIDIGLSDGSRSTELNPDTFQILLSPGNFDNLPPSAFRSRGNDLRQMRDATGHQITIAAQQTEIGYTLEAAIPWADLSLAPQPGLVLGLALNVNDNDRPGTAVQEVMMSNAPERKFTDPLTWGTLTLEAETVISLPTVERLLFLADPNMRGDDVRVVQQRLLDLGYTGVGEVDGIYGPRTEATVMAFQGDEDLDVDGIVGSITWSALMAAVPELVENPPPGANIVMATVARNETGLMVEQGQTVVIEYLSGSWRAGPSPSWVLVGPSGDNQVSTKASFPVRDAPLMSLIAGIGDEEPFLVGEQLELENDTGGELWLGPNDDTLADNAGALAVRIEILDTTQAEPPEQSPKPCAQAALPSLTNVWGTHFALLGCPSSAGESEVDLAFEDFEGGHMLWRSDNRRVYVLYDNGRWEQYDDTWLDGDPEYTCGTPTSPPTPRYGFGRVWCTNSTVSEGLGEAINVEQSTSGAVQEFTGGLIIRSNSNLTYVLFNDGNWL